MRWARYAGAVLFVALAGAACAEAIAADGDVKDVPLGIAVNVAAIAFCATAAFKFFDWLDSRHQRKLTAEAVKANNEAHAALLARLDEVMSTRPAQVLEELRDHVRWESQKYREEGIDAVAAAAERKLILDRLERLERTSLSRYRTQTPTKTKRGMMETEITTSVWQDVRYYASLAALVGVAVWALMAGTKGLWKLALSKAGASGKVENAALRGIALGYGAVGGYLLGAGWHGIGSFPGGVTAGVVGAGLSSLLYAVVKKRLKAAASGGD